MRRLSVPFGLIFGLSISLSTFAQEYGWAGRMGGSLRERGHGVAVDQDGNIYTTGRFEAGGDYDPGPGVFMLQEIGQDDAFVSKLDASGNFVWAKRLGGILSDYGWDVAVDGDGNVYTVGRFRDIGDFDPTPAAYTLVSAGDADAFLSKLDAAGDVVWARHFGGVSFDEALAIELHTNGDIYVSGHFHETADFDPGPAVFNLTAAGQDDAFLVKLDAAGEFLWARGVGGPMQDVVRDIALDGGGNVYTVAGFAGTVDFDPGAGVFNLTAAGYHDAVVSKLDAAGDLVWARNLGGALADAEAVGIRVDGGGDIYVTGQFLGTVDFDPGPGVVELTSSVDWYDSFVLKLDGMGNLVWARPLTGPDNVISRKVALDDGGGVYTVGYFYDTADFDPGPASFDLVAEGSTDVFISKLDAAGDFVWARRVGGAFTDDAHDVDIDSEGNVHVVGWFGGMADFDPSPDTSTLISEGIDDIFIVRLSPCGLFEDESPYGSLLFAPRCTADAAALPQDVYDSIVVGLGKAAPPATSEAFYLSAEGATFAPLAVDDAVHLNGAFSGLGPHAQQAEVPPFVLHTSIENNLVPLPAHEVTGLIPSGSSQVLFELLETQREIYGHTAVYLVRDCGIYMDKEPQTTLHWVSHDVEVNGFQSDLSVVSGPLSALRAGGDFSAACDLGAFTDTTEAVEPVPRTPPPGQGFYYLVSGTCGSAIGYGNSSAGPRAGLPTGRPCQ